MLILHASKMKHIKKQLGNISVWCFGSLQNSLLLVFMKSFLMLKFTFWGCDTAGEKLLDTVYQKELLLLWVEVTVISSEFTKKMCWPLERNQPDVAKGPQMKSTVTEVWTTHRFQSSGLRRVFRRSSAAFRSVGARKAWRRGAPCGHGAQSAARRGAHGEAGAGAYEGGNGKWGGRICSAKQNCVHGKRRCCIMLHVC